MFTKIRGYITVVSEAGLVVGDMIKKEGYDGWFANIKSFKAKIMMCKPYLADIQKAAAT